MSLTDEQIDGLIASPWMADHARDTWRNFARSIESATASPLLELIKELEADRDLMERNWNEAMAAHGHIAELEKQLEAAMVDAERYRKWRSEYASTATQPNELLSVLADAWDEQAVDAAIDAAIKEQA